MSTKRNLDTVKSETLEAVEISKRLESFDGGLNGVNRQMAKILTANRQPPKTQYFYCQPSNKQA